MKVTVLCEHSTIRYATVIKSIFYCNCPAYDIGDWRRFYACFPFGLELLLHLEPDLCQSLLSLALKNVEVNN